MFGVFSPFENAREVGRAERQKTFLTQQKSVQWHISGCLAFPARNRHRYFYRSNQISKM